MSAARDHASDPAAAQADAPDTAAPHAAPSVAPTAAALDALSREVAFRCTPDGTVRWADPRAVARLGLRVGDRLDAAVVVGSEEKARRLLGEAALVPVGGWELHLTGLDDASTTIVCSAAPLADGTPDVLVVASLVADDYGRLLGEMGESMQALARLHRETERQAREIARLDRDLRDAGQGMRALYDELADRDASLQAASESRGRLVADIGHELRAPLSSILGLAKLLASGMDGGLTHEQEKQVSFIRRSAEGMLDMVNDLLELSRLDAGRLRLRPAPFTVDTLFALLRGQLRPLAPDGPVALVLEDRTGGALLETDEGKIAQVLRNYLTNALKFTERGEVRLRAAFDDAGRVTFAVSDTGIGIAPAQQGEVWEEFTQLDSPLHRRHRGAGLGLALVQKLARVLEGEVGLQSAPGVGSTFTLAVPAVHPDVAQFAAIRERGEQIAPGEAPVLVLDDDPQEMFVYERFLAGSGFRVLPARDVAEARAVIQRVTPAAVVLDVMLDGETSWQFLEELRRDPRTCDVPTLVVTVLDRERKARALGASEFFVKPMQQEWLLRKLRALAVRHPEREERRVLVIDDDEVSRYLVRRLLADGPYHVLEASDGPEGVAMARRERPDVIVLDFVLRTTTAFDVLDQLKLDPDTRAIPVIVSTSRQLAETERQRLATETAAVVAKDRLSREVALARIREALTQAVPGAGVVAPVVP